jgi:hypothetical protein
MSVRKKLHAELEAPPELRAFGTGWFAGTMAFVLSLAALAFVLVLRQPNLFSVPQLALLHESNWAKPVLFAIMLVSLDSPASAWCCVPINFWARSQSC